MGGHMHAACSTHTESLICTDALPSSHAIAAGADGDDADISTSSRILHCTPPSPHHRLSSASAFNDSCSPTASLAGESLLQAAIVPQVAVHQPESRRYSSSGTSSRSHSPRALDGGRDVEATELGKPVEMDKLVEVAEHLSGCEEA